MPKLLSTKLLPQQAREKLEGAGIEVVSYDAIQCHYREASWDAAAYDHAVFTSQNAVRSVFSGNAVTLPAKVSCVGAKTGELLRDHGVQLCYQEPHAQALCSRFRQSSVAEKFIYFCGSKRLNTLPDFFKKEGLSYQEVIVYETHLNPVAHPETFDAILFLSPSAVESYLQENRPADATALCIGPTTAAFAQGHFKKIKTSESPTLESLLFLTKNLLTA